VTRIGLIGGMSWESTASYYRLLNEATSRRLGAWHQPAVLLDSLDFSQIVALQTVGDWDATGVLLADAARRLAAGGADLLAICANTMHVNLPEVRAAVDIPVLDVRDAMVAAIGALGAASVSLLGTRYLMTADFYTSHLERAGLRVVTPTAAQIDELHDMIFSELTQGVVTARSRARFLEIAEDCRARGGEVVGLCCTEFGLLFGEAGAAPPFVDSTVAHVDALLRA
jgi:aspartate racemase